MDVASILSLIGIPLAAVGADQVGVRQDARRWLREHRAELYVDLLVEAYAEKQWALGELRYQQMAGDGQDPVMFQRAREHAAVRDRRIPDLRMKPEDRARLGARMGAYATPEVTQGSGKVGDGGCGLGLCW